jgi:flavodoxin
MQKIVLLALTFFCLEAKMELNAQSGQVSQKTLVAYFSVGGNTAEIAGQIHKLVGDDSSTQCDLFQIVTVKKYPTEYSACGEVAKLELEQNARPALASEVRDMASYDTVFIGYPCWWGTMPMAIFTFLEKYDLSGKTLVPFTTHGGSGFGRSIQEIKKLCPKSTILEGIAVKASNVKRAHSDVAAWLKKIRIIK